MKRQKIKAAPRKMVVKVQISLSTSEAEEQVMIYDEDKAFFSILPISKCPGLKEEMADTAPLYRAFFDAELINGLIHLNDRLPEQHW